MRRNVANVQAAGTLIADSDMCDLIAADQLEILKGALTELAWLKALVEPEKTPIVMPLSAAPLPRERSGRSLDGRPPSECTEFMKHDRILLG